MNEFSFTLPNSGTVLTYKLLNGKDEKAISIINQIFLDD